MDNEWKNSLRERFSDYSAPEPEGLWEGIEQGLAEKKRRKMLPVWLVTGLAAAAAVALVVFLRPERTAETPVGTVERYVQDLTPDTSAASETPETEEAVPAVEPVDASASKPASFAVVSRRTLLSEAEPVTSVPVTEDVIPSDVNESVVVMGYSAEEIPEKVEPAEAIPVKEDPVDLVPGAVIPVSGDLESSVSSHSRFSVGAYHFGGQETTEQSQGFGLSKTGPMYTRSLHPGSKQTTGSLMQMLSSNQASSYEAHHGAPVRVGMTFAWNFTPHLSLASGLNWTSLTSTFEESTSGIRSFTRQNLGYVGVPLRLEAGIQPWKGLRLYAGAGGMVEKGLLAKSVTDSFIGDYLEESVVKHPDTGGLLWSVGASAGAEYRFNRIFSLYFAPGIEYHFDNGSAVKSAYTEKPLHWNMALGVRFNFQK